MKRTRQGGSTVRATGVGVHTIPVLDAFYRATEPDVCPLCDLCLPHTRLLIRESYSGLPAATRSQYTHLLRRQLHDGLTRLDQELGWFIQKFDYRFRQADWHNTKSAPERAAARLAGVSVSAGK